jgi:photosystem II stability/assembly factor-like uncharacterized protein
MMIKKNNNLKSVVWLVVLLSTFINGVQAQNDWSLVYSQSYRYVNFCETSNGDMFCTRENFVIVKSTNSGNTWTQLNSGSTVGLPANTYRYINAYQDKLFLYNRDYTGYPVASPKGFFVSTNGGLNWTKKNTGLGADTVIFDMQVTKNGLLFIIAGATESTTTYKLYRSANFGDTWTFIQNLDDKFFRPNIVRTSNGTLYFQVYNTLYKSTNQGVSWTGTVNNLFGIDYLQVASNDSLYGFSGPHLYRSIDGISWTQVNMTNWQDEITYLDNAASSFLILPDNTFIATIGTTNGANAGIYKSTDLGKTWTTFYSGMNSNRQVYSDAIWFSSKTGYMFASPNLTGIYKTTSTVFTPTSIFSPAVIDSYSLTVGPNPTATITTLTYTLKSSDNVTIEILDTQGKLLLTVVKEEIQNAGEQQRTIDLSNLLPGVYMVQVRTAKGSSVKRVVVE